MREGVYSLEGPAVALLARADAAPQARRSGVLLHVTSLPGPFGSGDFGRAAHAFVDWLKQAGQSLWQVLPITVTGLGNSPYMGVSAFAGNELLVDLEGLKEEGWLAAEDLLPAEPFEDGAVDYPKVAAFRLSRLRAAAKAFFASGRRRAEYDAFVGREASWLADYALYRALQARYGAQGASRWQEWPEGIRRRDAEALRKAREDLADDIRFWQFCQWVFDRQWRALRGYAHARGVSIVGDMPIFVSPEGADIWAHQELFDLDAAGEPTFFAGVPPDYFSPTGQFWGNPLYKWEAHRADGYRWWVARLTRAAALYDTVRIDHFRGFEAFWRIPRGALATEGHWRKGPGAEPFEAFARTGATIDFIAEDLGTITREVTELRRALRLPGMRVLQFAFDGNPANPHAPCNVEENAALYTGTHDNDTVRGWFGSLDARVQDGVRKTLCCLPEEIPEAAVQAVLNARARIAVVPVQDILGLGTEARMNQPGDAKGAWRWRLAPGLLTGEVAERLARWTVRAGRAAKAG